MTSLLHRLFRRRPPGGLTCVEIVELVTDYLEDALPPADRRRFDQHLGRCDGCTRYLEQLRMTLAMLGELRTVDLSPAAEQELRAAFRDWRSAATDASPER
jgi:anti-sigma factor RsiW